MMFSDEEEDEDGLSDYVIQLNILESCRDPLLSLVTETGEKPRGWTGSERGEEPPKRPPVVSGDRDGRGWLPLHRAAVQPVPEVLKAVLRSAPRRLLEERTAGGETALTLAVQAGRSPNVRTLLEHGASPHAANGRNETPLLLAVKAGSYEMTQALVTYGAWADQVCRRNWTATHEAAKGGDTDILLLLLRNGGRVNHEDSTGATPLAVAAEHGHAHVTEVLLSCGSRVNSQAFNGESVLLDAAGSGDVACIQLLLDHGADANLPNATGLLPVHRAAFAGRYRALEVLIPRTARKAIKEAGQSPMHSAAEGGHAHCLQLLLARGFDVNYRLDARTAANYRDMRRTALYFAVSNGDAECARILLAGGARTDLDPLSCLLVAVRSGRHDLARLLLASGADVNRRFTAVSDTLFPTALQYCLKDPPMMRLLLASGYDVQQCFRCHHGNASDPDDPDEDACRKIPFCEFMSLCCVLHLSGQVVQVLLDYTAHVHICPRLRDVLEKQPEWPEIRRVLGSPRSLGHLCRLQMRRSLTPKRLNNPKIMNSHFIPPRLKRFLLYQELDLYSSTGP